MTNLICEQPVMRRVYFICYCRRLWASDIARASLTLALIALLVGVVSLEHVWNNFQSVEDWGGRGQFLFAALAHTTIIIQAALALLGLLVCGWFFRLFGGAKSLVNFF